MTKIAVYQVREEELPIVEKWSKDNNVEVKIIDGQITPENVHLAKGFDGVTTSQNMKVPTEVYEKLHEYGIKQIAQRSAGFDYYDLEAATKNDIIISNVPVYSPESIDPRNLSAIFHNFSSKPKFAVAMLYPPVAMFFYTYYINFSAHKIRWF